MVATSIAADEATPTPSGTSLRSNNEKPCSGRTPLASQRISKQPST